MKCRCEDNCIKTKSEIIDLAHNSYSPCPDCDTKVLKKAMPLKLQIKLDKIDNDFKRCPTCSKRNIDIVMANVLKVMFECSMVDDSTSIRNVGTPLITPALHLNHIPYLPANSLVLLTPHVDLETAKKIQEIPEIKAVIKGSINDTVGVITQDTQPYQYNLLSGCDIRCDIQNTPMGEIVLYKLQSMMHIEYPKIESPKIKQLDEVLDKYDDPTVVDAMASSGTLGIYSLMKNAKKVVFNDIYDVALDTLRLNLKMNEIPEDKYEIYNHDVNKLPNILNGKYDLGIVDAFPNVDTKEYKESLEKICREVIII